MPSASPTRAFTPALPKNLPLTIPDTETEMPNNDGRVMLPLRDGTWVSVELVVK